MPWMYSNAEVIGFLSGSHVHLLLSSNTGSLEGFRGNLFLFFRDKMDTAWVDVPASFFLSIIVETEFWVRHTTVEA